MCPGIAHPPFTRSFIVLEKNEESLTCRCAVWRPEIECVAELGVSQGIVRTKVNGYDQPSLTRSRLTLTFGARVTAAWVIENKGECNYCSEKRSHDLPSCIPGWLGGCGSLDVARGGRDAASGVSVADSGGGARRSMTRRIGRCGPSCLRSWSGWGRRTTRSFGGGRSCFSICGCRILGSYSGSWRGVR